MRPTRDPSRPLATSGRAFKATPDHPVVDYLVRLHADLGGQIFENRKQAERLAENMKHVEAVIRLYDPTFNMKRIACRRRYKGNPWFKRGTLFRGALDVLREATEPLTVRQITERMLAAHGVTDASVKAVRDLTGGVQASIQNHDGGAVVRVGEGMPGRWRLALTD